MLNSVASGIRWYQGALKRLKGWSKYAKRIVMPRKCIIIYRETVDSNLVTMRSQRGPLWCISRAQYSMLIRPYRYFILWDIVDPRTESNPNPNPNPEPNPKPNPNPNPNPKPNPNLNLILTADSLYLIRWSTYVRPYRDCWLRSTFVARTNI